MPPYTSVALACKQCGKTFHVQRHRFLKGTARFCSLACCNESKKEPVEPRFWNYVNKDGPLPSDPSLGNCWLWIGSTSSSGYGVFDKQGTHRVAYELATQAKIPKGLHVCHKCDMRDCVRASHLFLGTHDDNMRDRQHKGRTHTGDKPIFAIHPERRLRGEKHGMAKLTEDQVREIRRRSEAGETTKGLARVFRMNPCSVRDIIRRNHWKHVS